MFQAQFFLTIYLYYEIVRNYLSFSITNFQINLILISDSFLEISANFFLWWLSVVKIFHWKLFKFISGNFLVRILILDF